MRCFNSNSRSLSPTRQNIRSILTDTENLYAEIQNAYNNDRLDVAGAYASCGNLLWHLRDRMRTKSGDDPNVLRNRFSSIQNEFDSLINPISHFIKNDQSTGRTRPEK